MGTHTIFLCCALHYAGKHSANTNPSMAGQKLLFTELGIHPGLTLILVAILPASAMTPEIKNLFHTFLLDKATLQVNGYSTLHCTAITALLIFIKRSECPLMNSLLQVLTQTRSI